MTKGTVETAGGSLISVGPASLVTLLLSTSVCSSQDGWQHCFRRGHRKIQASADFSKGALVGLLHGHKTSPCSIFHRDTLDGGNKSSNNCLPGRQDVEVHPKEILL